MGNPHRHAQRLPTLGPISAARAQEMSDIIGN
jgi:hypothetical protein